MKTAAFCVIGHVNHGKTALVRALTGRETDRTPEEKRRGISIELGFAAFSTDTAQVHLIDAPGHEDFIRATTAGLSAAYGCLLVVSALRGPERQTIEHLEMARALGIDVVVAALSHSDSAGADHLGAATERTAELLRSFGYSGASILPVSSLTGAGLLQLRAKLAQETLSRPPPEELAGFLLSIDRRFSAAGAGTIVTGVLQGGEAVSGQDALILPGGDRFTIRSIQCDRREVDRAEPGGRIALALRGLKLEKLRTGHVVCAPGAFEASVRIDAEIRFRQSWRPRGRVAEQIRLFAGAAAVTARLRLFQEVDTDKPVLARIDCDRPIVSFAGQRLIIRGLSPDILLAGGRVLDPGPPERRLQAARRAAFLADISGGLPESVACALTQRDQGVLSEAEYRRLTNGRLPPASEEWISLEEGVSCRREDLERARQSFLCALAGAHEATPLAIGIPAGRIRTLLNDEWADRMLAEAEGLLAREGLIRRTPAGLRLQTHNPRLRLSADEARRLKDLETALAEGMFRPPEPGGEGEELLNILADEGVVIALYNHALRKTVYFHADTPCRARDILKAAFPAATPFTTGQAREALSTSRKFIVPLLEHLDGAGLTRRTGDLRFIS